MTMPLSQLPPDPAPLLARAVVALAAATGMPVTFGGPVSANGRDLVIDHLHGTTTRSLLRLRVAAGAGLGGKALALARPCTVDDYLHARGITHRYDRAVAPERLCTMVAMPVCTGSGWREGPKAVLYAAARWPTSLGDRLLRAAAVVVRRLERDLAVELEVHRRLSAISSVGRAGPTAGTPAGLSLREVDELHDQLLVIAGSVDDDATRDRLLAVCQRVRERTAAARPAASAQPRASVDAAISARPARPTLAPREIQSLAQVALGRTNDEAAAALGLLPNTVKSYLKDAMRKLGATNRIQAVNQARRLGLID
jgi:LuxR family transcriptional regulator, regulator of acetate metabolism